MSYFPEIQLAYSCCCYLQEALDMRHSESMKRLHFVSSIVEISFTEFVVVVHMLNARSGYVAVRQVTA